MGALDITGLIQEGMWNYEYPFPEYKLKKLPKVEWLENDIFCEIFEGLHSQTGTYVETPAHFYGNDKCYLINDVPLDKLINIKCTVLKIKKEISICDRTPINLEDLLDCSEGINIKKGNAIIVGTGWGKFWTDEIYLKSSPFFTYDAMMWLVNKEPYLLGSDFPRWENLDSWQGFFPEFYRRNILMLAPCVNIEKVKSSYVRLTVMPMNIKGTSCVPCRAFINEEP